jgi:hypothetical protein
MTETAYIYEPREWSPVSTILFDLAQALGSLELALRELNVAVFKKRHARLLR